MAEKAPARVVVTSRAGGISVGPYAQGNLASHVGDEPGAVAANRARLAEALGVPPGRLVVLQAVSGGPVGVVGEDGLPDLGERAGVGEGAEAAEGAEVDGVEALVTRATDLGLAVLVADCVPVLLADVQAGVIGAAHSGRRGLAAGIVPATVAAMLEQGASADRMTAWVGPGICGSCYEVGAAVQAEVATLVPASVSTTAWGTPGLDLLAGVRAQLAARGRQQGPSGPALHAGRPNALLLPPRRCHRTLGRGDRPAVVTDQAATGEAPIARDVAVAEGLARTRARIAQAARDAGRDPDDITLVVVTKTHPAADVALLTRLGVRDIGENREQEAAPKAAEASRLGVPSDLRWHFVGQLQTNKVSKVVAFTDVVHSVDRLRLVHALDRAAGRLDRSIGCFVQVSLDEAVGARAGAAPAAVAALAAAVASSEALELLGVMAVAPLVGPLAEPDDAFARLADVAADVRAAHPRARWVSAGMSGDLESAIRHGATHVRVGSAILGTRQQHG